MGLLESLGLKPRTVQAKQPALAGDSGTDAGGSGDPVVEQHDIIAEMLASVPDEKAKAGLEAELAALRAKHAKSASPKAELAEAAKLYERAKKLAFKFRQERELSDARADVDAVVQQITALVLGGINDDAARKKINDELTKLKANVATAAKIADPKAAVTAYNALLTKAQDLRARADQTQFAVDFSQATLAPQLATAQTAINAAPAAPKAVLQKELDSLKADIKRYDGAADSTALQSIVAPRLKKLNDVAGGLAKASTQADADLARAATLVQALDPAGSADLRSRLTALQDQKKTAWPAGNSLDEIAASIDAVTDGAKTLIADAEALKTKLAVDKEIAALRKRVDGLKPRTDKASEAPVSSFVESWQQKVREALANFQKYEAARDLKSCEVVFSQLGAALDNMEQFKAQFAAFRAKFDAARDGGVKKALAVALKPAGLAALRTQSLNDKGAEIETLADTGYLMKADKAIATWLNQAKTWGASQAAYNNLRSGHPVVGAMKDLIAEPGGGEVFDAIVADLPDDTAAVNVTAAIEARFDIEVTQFNHRKPEDADGATYTDESKALNPKDPQKGLKDLYKVLRIVPVKDAKYTEKIVDYQEQGHGAYYQSGVINDKIVMYAGRPDDANNNVELGDVVPTGERPDPNSAPVGGVGAKVNWYSFAALHEVAHGVDDARGVMKSHMAEAGWETHGSGAIAKKVAAFFSYDADYIESMMDSKSNTPPKKKPKRPADVKTDAEWETARQDAETWVTESREKFDPWNKADAAKRNAIGGRVYHESYAGDWVSYHLAARSTGVRGYQFRAPAEWFAELYAAFHIGKMNPKHPDAGWLLKLKAESES